jgi:hypothetical protein
VGEPLSSGTWHNHHIFPNERFKGERAALQKAYEDAEEEDNENEMRRITDQRAKLETRIFSLGNLAFLTPETNSSIGNTPPTEYLREIASTPDGRASLEAQLIPIEPELWKHTSFDAFRRRRCELLAAKAKEFFFPG